MNNKHWKNKKKKKSSRIYQYIRKFVKLTMGVMQVCVGGVATQIIIQKIYGASQHQVQMKMITTDAKILAIAFYAGSASNPVTYRLVNVFFFSIRMKKNNDVMREYERVIRIHKIILFFYICDSKYFA